MQVSDDPELLKLMLDDTAEASDLYKPTNYWAIYEKKFIPELQEYGLYNFRKRRNSILSSFGATDLSHTLGQIDLFKSKVFYNCVTRKIPLWSELLSLQNTLLNKILPVVGTYKIEEFEQMLYEFIRMYGEKIGAKSVDEFEASLAGNPEGIVKIDGRVYTMAILGFYIQYVYCCNFINFDDVKIMVELGSGSGKQIEVMRKLYPDICFLVFDIPPQLYVCEQYLKSVFPGDVVSYRETKQMDSFSGEHKGKIFMFGNWKFPMIEEIPVDLFWNASSFQEMEPEVVANYLKFVNRSAKSVYLLEVMGGKEVASKKGDRGVLKQITIEDYKKGLTNFKLRDMSPPYWPISKRSMYSFSFWECSK